MPCTSACRLFSPESPWPRNQKVGFPKGRTGCSKKKGTCKEEGEGPGRKKVPGRTLVTSWTSERCMEMNDRGCPKTSTGDI